MTLVPCELVICDEVPVDVTQPKDSPLVTPELTPDVKQLGSQVLLTLCICCLGES